MECEALPECWRRLRETRDPAAREALIDHYGYLVRVTAARFAASAPRRIEHGDLIQAASLGLMRAVDQFDPGREVKFERYALFFVRGAVLELLRREDWAPRSVRKRIKGLDAAEVVLLLEQGAHARPEELAERLGISLERLFEIQQDRWQAAVISLDETVGLAESKDENLFLRDTLEDRESDAWLQLTRQMDRELLGECVLALIERERLVLSLYYFEGLTFQRIGRILGFSESRIFQLHQQALGHLRARYEARAANEES